MIKIIKKYIKMESKKQGIDIIGFTNEYKSEKMKKELRERKEKKRNTEFEEESIDKRLNYSRLLGTTNTLISIGLSYNLNEKYYTLKKKNKLQGTISRHALGKDYHNIIKTKAKKLMEKVAMKYPNNYYIGVDTTPLLDRQIAYKSGIGFYGRNTNIINRKYGSFIFLAYILTDLIIDPDNCIDENTCGECITCEQYCPAGAIGDYKINPIKCISYLTQTKKHISYENREKMGIKIYGCDVCQEVCPKNKDVLYGNIGNFEIETIDSYIDLSNLINITKKDFEKRYSHTAIGWRGVNILRRNALIAISNHKKAPCIFKIEALLYDGSEMIRNYALWTLIKIDKEKTLKKIKETVYILDKDLKIELKKILKYLE